MDRTVVEESDSVNHRNTAARDLSVQHPGNKGGASDFRCTRALDFYTPRQFQPQPGQTDLEDMTVERSDH